MLHRLESQGARFSVNVAHRRWGKSLERCDYVLNQAIMCPWSWPRYAFFAPTQKQARSIIWQEMIKAMESFPDNLKQALISKDVLYLKRPWTRGGKGDFCQIQILGSEQYDKVRGLYLDGVNFDEFAFSNPKCYSEGIRAALKDRKGFASFISTVKGENHFKEIYDDYSERMLNPLYGGMYHAGMWKANESGVFTAEELEEERLNMPEGIFQQEFMCDWHSTKNRTIFIDYMRALENRGQITNVPYDPMRPVHTAWDLGTTDAMAVWFFQKNRGTLNIIRYFEETGRGLEYFHTKLLEFGYNYGNHYMPFDIKKKNLITAKRDSLQYARDKFGVNKLKEVKKVTNIFDRIERGREVLPRCYFDKVNCSRGIAVLKEYAYAVDQKTGLNTKQLAKNWAIHGGDAFTYLAMMQDSTENEELDFDHQMFENEIMEMRDTSGSRLAKIMGPLA